MKTLRNKNPGDPRSRRKQPFKMEVIGIIYRTK